MKVLNFGSLNLDYVYQVEHFAAPGETISAVRQSTGCGGKGLNQSVALARAGAEVYHAGCIGRGGEPLRSLLERCGVDTSCLREVDEIQGNAVIQVVPSGENCILLFGGSNYCVETRQIRETMEKFEAGDYLVLQNEINALPGIVDLAYEKGMRIILNPSPWNERLRDVDFHKLSWLLMNEVEAHQISGSGEPERTWKNLHVRYPQLSMVLTLGSRGSICFTEGECIRQEAFSVKAVDTTAAGDTFTGFFIAGLTEGLPLKQCMEQAAKAAAVSVARPGAALSIPTKEETEAYFIH